MDVLNHMADHGVIGLLVGLSLWALAVAVERWLYCRRVGVSQFDNIQTMEMALARRLVAIGTVAANAPCIGLVGAVLGLCSPFMPWAPPAQWLSGRLWPVSAWP